MAQPTGSKPKATRARKAAVPGAVRQRRKGPEERRQELLAATITCLSKLGPRAATGREICRQAGVSHGLLRHYFGTPEVLFLEAYRDLCDRFLREFERSQGDPGQDPWAALNGFFKTLFSPEWSSSEMLDAWSGFWTLVRSDPAFAQVSEAFNQRLRELLVDALRRLPAKAPPRIGFENAALIVSAVMDGLWLDLSIAPDRLTRARAVELCQVTIAELFANSQAA